MSKAVPAEATVRRFEDDTNTLQALISCQADVVGVAATQVANLEKVAGPDRFEQKVVLSRRFNASAFRQGQTELASALDGVTTRELGNGELARSYSK